MSLDEGKERGIALFAMANSPRLVDSQGATGCRLGLRRVKGTRWRMVHLTPIGRRSGQESGVIPNCFEDVPNPIAMLANGSGDGELAWPLNLQASRIGRRSLRLPDKISGRPPQERRVTAVGQMTGDRHESG